ncbi:molybdopterin-synthase adenylyltransferase MoeB [Propionibacteriaceae bacterium Y2011]|uniref:molybdopterin-synthase adenylyltransferase MoeB n=1 Tax=Microlunatus sp. Y2014 TaxID=3418488 RepID=UPI003B446A3B
MTSRTQATRTPPPLVEPAAELTPAETARYARHLILPQLGSDGQRRLKNARVLVIGAGGLGSPALLYLAAAGVGTLGVIDFDDVEESNLHRQVIHGQADIGRPKVESARDTVASVNPLVRFVAHHERLDNDNAVALFTSYDLILDGTDNFATRYLVNDAAELAGRPYVWGSIFRFAGQVSVFWSGHGPTYRDLFPEPPPAGTVPSCAEGGVLGVLCSAIGSVMATEAVKLITGIGDSLLGRVLIHDALAMTYDTIELKPDPDRTPVTALTDYVALCGVPPEPVAADGDEITVAELRRRLDERDRGERDFVLVDVREPGEWEVNRIPGAVLVPQREFAAGRVPAAADDGRPIILYCKVGVRSANCLAVLHSLGRADAVHVAGGVDAWVAEIEPHQARY